MEREQLPHRNWVPMAVVALVVLCGAAVLCGLAGAMAFSRPRATPFPPQAPETATPETTAPSAPLPSAPSSTPTAEASPTSLPSTPTPVPSPTPEPSPTPTSTPTPACPSVGGPFAALWESYRDRLGCAQNTAHTSWMAQEHFEYGQMFWREDNDRITVLYNAGTWALYRDIWKEGDPEYSCPEIAPSRCPPTPRRGFGKIWCTYPAVRQRLGWATNYERGFHGTVQDFEQGAILRTDTGETYVLLGDGTWVSP